MKRFTVVRFPESYSYQGPSNQTLRNKMPCGTELVVDGKVKGIDGIVYYLSKYNSKRAYVPSDQIVEVEEV